MGERKQQRRMQWSWGKMALLGSWAVVGGLAFYLGRVCLQPEANAGSAPAVARAQDSGPTTAASGEAGRDIVAYIYGTTAITRQELGEYLIARQGAERLDLLINRRIVDFACQQAGVTVAPQEIEAALKEDLVSFNCDEKQFVSTLLKQYGKTLFEWKEDVIRPKLLLNKLCQSQVQASEQDLRACFDAKYGEKVEGRIILWPHGEEKVAQRMYADIRVSEEAFAQAAREQANPRLASTGGKIHPMGRNSTGSPELERAMFSLQPNQMSELVGTPEGVVVFKCDKRIPADTSKNFDAEQPFLKQEVLARKTTTKIGEVFVNLRAQAKPMNMMKPTTPTQAEREREAEQTLKEANIPLPKFGTPVSPPVAAPMPGAQ